MIGPGHFVDRQAFDWVTSQTRGLDPLDHACRILDRVMLSLWPNHRQVCRMSDQLAFLFRHMSNRTSVSGSGGGRRPMIGACMACASALASFATIVARICPEIRSVPTAA
jgi:hypothetical protein